MFHAWKMVTGSLLVVALIAGCQTQTFPTTTTSSSQAAHDSGDSPEGHQREAADARVAAALARLSPQDQPIAKAQQYCAVMNQSRLGSMGTPIKLEIKSEPVFVCCSGCKAKALRNPEETLAKVAALKAGGKAAP